MSRIFAALAAGLLAAAIPVAMPSATADSGLDRFYGQHLEWKSCDDPGLDKAGAQCADVTVPLNYAQPQGKTITVAISRLAADPATRRGVLLSNPGGPGGPGLDMTVELGKAMTPRVRASYDLIGMDPRGIGRSSVVNCHWPRGFGLQSAGPTLASYAESVAAQADLAARCFAAEGERIRYITTRNTARDMDVIRGALGAERINYFGVSYGTYLGAVYTQMFPDRSDRIVLDSSVDPDRYAAGDNSQMGPANEAAFDLWAGWAAEHDGDYHLGTTVEQVRGFVADLLRRAAASPIRVGRLSIGVHDLPVVLFQQLNDPRNYHALAETVRRFADAADGKPVTLAPGLTDMLTQLLNAEPTDLSPQTAVMCGDVEADRDPQSYWRTIESVRATQPLFGAFVNNITPCAFWAAPIEPKTVIDNSVPALIVQSTGDTRTAYAGAQAMHRDLKASRMVTLQDVAVHGLFANYPAPCVDNAVNTYFATGALPATDTTCTG
ncbi:alpha/beta hydrolase [Nocardia panacis]|uniref:alpha/beta hydrolase n=1 Tax=Nocardia panacis TaxID=2340916 RepID=UPI001EF0B3E3|nr:alpha/beta hydrolase [Nocardia panacis]